MVANIKRRRPSPESRLAHAHSSTAKISYRLGVDNIDLPCYNNTI